MKRLKYLTFLLCSALASFLILACSNVDDSDSSSNEKPKTESKVEVGTEYKVPVGRQFYRMVTKTGNFSSEKTEVWYYDEEDNLVYYNEIINSDQGGDVVSESISYTDEKKTKFYGKEKHSNFFQNDVIVDLYEYYEGENITSATVEVYDQASLTFTTCEYDPNKTEKNVFKYSILKLTEGGNDEELTEYYAKNLTIIPSSREVTGELLVEKKVIYQYGKDFDVFSGLPLCTGFITIINDYDDTYSQSDKLELLRTTSTLTEYRWNQELYPGNPMEEISYNVEFDEEKKEYVPVKQSGYKVVQLADFEGQKKAIQEIWLTSDGEIQYKYVYDYDIDNTYELDPESYDQNGEKPLYMTKKNFYQNSSNGLFLAESSEFLKYNAGDNKEFCYQIEIHKVYDKM